MAALDAAAPAAWDPLAPASLVARADAQLPLTTRLRIEAGRRLAHDEELEDIERELRRDLHGAGASLSWDTARVATAPQPVPALAAYEASKAAEAGGGGHEDPDHEIDRFGEEEGHEKVVPRALTSADGGEDGWRVQSQIPWDLGKEMCTLTIFQNVASKLTRFEVLRPGSVETLYITCSDEYFDALCQEETALAGTAQVNAAIRRILTEAMEEHEAAAAADARLANGEGAPHLATGTAPPEEPKRSAAAAAAASSDERRKSVTDDFGCDDGEAATVRAAKPVTDEEGFHVQSQEPFQVDEERCTLTIFQNDDKGLLRFELLKLSNWETLYINCTVSQFDELCKEQVGLSGPLQVTAATRQLFKEAMEELKSAPP